MQWSVMHRTDIPLPKGRYRKEGVTVLSKYKLQGKLHENLRLKNNLWLDSLSSLPGPAEWRSCLPDTLGEEVIAFWNHWGRCPAPDTLPGRDWARICVSPIMALGGTDPTALGRVTWPVQSEISFPLKLQRQPWWALNLLLWNSSLVLKNKIWLLLRCWLGSWFTY